MTDTPDNFAREDYLYDLATLRDALNGNGEYRSVTCILQLLEDLSQHVDSGYSRGCYLAQAKFAFEDAVKSTKALIDDQFADDLIEANGSGPE